jgi:transcriptional regulator of acetoin/glycerol metabolism
MGLNAVAAPVHDARGNVIAAVDIWGPAFRLTPRRIPELAAQAREAAASISVRLGGTGTATAAQPTLAQALSHTTIAGDAPADSASPAGGLVSELPTGVAAAS